MGASRKRKWRAIEGRGVRQVDVKSATRIYQFLTKSRDWKDLPALYQDRPTLHPQDLVNTKYETSKIRTVCKYCRCFTNHSTSCQISSSNATTRLSSHVNTSQITQNSTIDKWLKESSTSNKTTSTTFAEVAEYDESWRKKKKARIEEDQISQEELNFLIQAETQYQQKQSLTTSTSTTTTTTTSMNDSSSISDDVTTSEEEDDASDSNSTCSNNSVDSSNLYFLGNNSDDEEEEVVRNEKKRTLDDARDKLVQDLEKQASQEPNPIVFPFIEEDDDQDEELDIDDDDEADQFDESTGTYPYLNAFLEQNVIPSLPNFHSHTPKISGNYLGLLTHLLPDPLSLKGELQAYQLTSEAHAFSGSRLHILDPHLLSPEWIGEQANHKLICKMEHNGVRCGNNLSRNGFAKGFHFVRGLPPFEIVKAVELTCHECKYYQSIRDTWSNRKITLIKELRVEESKLEILLNYTEIHTNLSFERWVPAVIATKFTDKKLCKQYIENNAAASYIPKLQRMISSTKPFPKSRTIRSFSPEIVSQLSKMGQYYYNFIVIGRNLLSVSINDLIGSLIPKGQASFNGIRSSIKEAITTHLARAEVNRLHAIRFIQSKPSLHKYGFGKEEKFVSSDENCLSFVNKFELPNLVAQRLVIRLCRKLENMIHFMLLCNALDAPSMGFDHVHLQRNSGRNNGATASFVAVNHIGAPIFACMQNNKSVKELDMCLKIINEFSKSNGGRGFWVVFTDNLKADKNTITRCFPDAQAAEDLFHFFKSLYECVDKNSVYFSLWVACITFAAYEFDPEDIERLKQKGIPESDLKDPRYLQKNRDKIRPILAPVETFLQKLQTIVFAFFELGCLNRNTTKMLKTVKVDAQNAFNLPKDYPQFINIGSQDDPIYRALRGTGMCENINRQLQALQSQTWSPGVTHSVCLLLLMRRSMDLNRVVSKKEYLEDLYDLEVINDLILAQKPFVEGTDWGVQSLAVNTFSKEFDDRSKDLSTFRKPINSSQRALPANLDPDTLHRKKNLELKPFNANCRVESRLLRAMCRTGDYFRNKKKVLPIYLDSEGLLTLQFFKDTSEKTTNKVLYARKLCDHWNKYVYACQVHKKSSVTILNVKIDLSSVSSKEPSHISKFFDEYAIGCFKKMSNLEMPVQLSQNPPSPLIPPQQITQEVPETNPGLAAKFPDIPPNNVNQVPFNPSTTTSTASSHLKSSKKRGQSSSSMQVKATKINNTQIRKRQPCPECSLMEHAESSTCRFHRFLLDTTVQYPKPNNLSKRQQALLAWDQYKDTYK